MPPYAPRWQPRPMNASDRFLSGDWRKYSWEAYISKENEKAGRTDLRRGGPAGDLARRVILAFFGALLADIALTFIIWLSLMMAISVFDLQSKWGLQIDSFKLLIGTFAVLFVLLFLGFIVFIRPKKIKS